MNEEKLPHGAGILKINTGYWISIGFDNGDPKGKIWAITFPTVPGASYYGEFNYQSTDNYLDFAASLTYLKTGTLKFKTGQTIRGSLNDIMKANFRVRFANGYKAERKGITSESKYIFTVPTCF